MNEKELSRKDVENIYYRVRCYYEVKAKPDEDILSFDTPYSHNHICRDYIHNIRLNAWRNLDILKNQCMTIIQSETHQPFDYTLWETIATFDKYEYWFIRYKKLKSDGKLDFIEKYNK